jgi:hypothetical protein
MTNISDYCANNQDYLQLMEKFTKNYIAVYNKRKVAMRNEVKILMSRNFNTWYYSDAPACYLSPARFVNSDIYHKFGSDAMVFPACKPVFKKDKLMDITYDFRVFTLDDHPFIGDMHLFLEATREILPGSELGDGIDGIINSIYRSYSDPKKQGRFTFDDPLYLVLLGDICLRMSLLTLEDDDAEVLPDEENIKAFFDLPGRDRLERVITMLIERFVQSFGEVGLPKMQLDAADVAAALEEEQNIDFFMENLFYDMYNDLGDLMGSVLVDDRDPETFFESMEPLDLARMKEMFEAKTVLTICSSHFFTVFGQYLQLIQPEHDNNFEFMQTDDEFLKMLDSNEDDQNDPGNRSLIEVLLYYFPPGGYSLTALGAARAGKDLSQTDEQLYPLVLKEEYQVALKDILKENIGENMSEILTGMLDDFKGGGGLFSAIADIFSRERLDKKPYRGPDPLEGLNPDNLPFFNYKNATYIFKVKRRTITLKGTDTLADLSFLIKSEFDLDEERLSSFYMGAKFFDSKREITCPRLCLFGGDEPTEAENYKIHQLNLYEKQKFLYLHDFTRENRFTVTFAGIKE